MNNRWLFAVAALAAACGISGMAAAQSLAHVAPGTTNLRDGPGTRYPVVARVYGGTPVEVYGCLVDRSWCEVSVDEIVGWMAASRLQFVYAGRRVYVPDYYSHFRAPIIEFRIDRDRSWRDRERWCRYYEDDPRCRRYKRRGETLPPPEPLAPGRERGRSGPDIRPGGGETLPPPEPLRRDNQTGVTVVPEGRRLPPPEPLQPTGSDIRPGRATVAPGGQTTIVVPGGVKICPEDQPGC